MVSNIENQSDLEDFFLGLNLPNETSIDESDFGSAGTNSLILRQAAMKAVKEMISKFSGTTAALESRNTLIAFFLFVGVTSEAKQIDRMRRVNEKLIAKLGLGNQYAAIETMFKNKVDGFVLDGTRLSTAFPDYAFMYHSILAKGDYVQCQLIAYQNKPIVELPVEICYAQSLQMDLEENLQRLANEYNRHYWLSVVSSTPEVNDGPHFVEAYFRTSKEDKYTLLFFADMFTDDLKSINITVEKTKDNPEGVEVINVDARTFVNGYIRAPYTLRMVKFYRLLVKKYFKTARPMDTSTVQEIYALSEVSSPEEAHRAPAAISPFADARRDGVATRLISGTPEYEEAKRQSMSAMSISGSNENPGRQRRLQFR